MSIFKTGFKKSPATIFTLLFLSILFVNTTPAAPGDLDLTFGNGGIARTPIGKISADYGYAAALQSDGKIVVAGLSTDGLRSNFAVSRLNPDGTLDNSFGTGGRAVKIVSYFSTNYATAVVIQPDGKIIAGGVSRHLFSFANCFTLVRFNADGSSDNSFGTGGIVQTIMDTSASSWINALAIQPDGKILAAGYTFAGSQSAARSMAIARYNPNGSLDTTFDGDGKLLVNFDATSGNRANAVVIQPDGKIVVGGFGQVAGNTDFALVRLNTDGTFDTTFDGDGKATKRIGIGSSGAQALALQPDGKIVAAAFANINADGEVVAARYNTDGTPDTSFDGDGIASANVEQDTVSGVAVQPDGKIIVSGHATFTANSAGHFIAVRFNSDGSPDNSFDGDGKVSTQVTNSFSQAKALLLQPNGKIVVVGYSFNANYDMSLVRYNTDGSLDTSFDGDGKAFAELRNSIDVVLATAIQPDGKIVAAGYSFGGVNLEVTVARYNSNGTLDASFGIGGAARTPFANTNSFARKVAVQPDGKIVVAVNDGNPRYTLVRYNADGSPDSSFGAAGILTLPLETINGNVNGLAIQPDGKIVAGGFTFAPDNNRDISIIRLNANGTLDASFGSGGVVVTNDTTYNDTINYLTLQPNGKIVLAGQSFFTAGSPNMFVVARYNNDGSPDAGFGDSGKVHTPVESITDSGANAVQVQADGKIVAAGFGADGFALVRYNVNGSLDNSFDGDGIVKTVIIQGGGFDYQAYGLGIQQTGKIVAAGTATINGQTLDAAVFRYNPDGSLDGTFGTGGKVITTMGGRNSEYYAMSLQADDKIIGGGYSSNGENDDFTLVRYLSAATVTRPALFDFDGDGKSDISVFRPSDGTWYLLRSQAGFTATQFGIASDKIAPADYDGDGKTDLGVFRDGVWYLLRSQAGFTAVQFGAGGDLPRPADFDGDGKADICVFRPSDGTWYRLNSSNGQFVGVQFGANGDKPVPADFDGDGKADVNVYRPSTGSWYRLNSGNNQFVGIQFGVAEDLPTPADFDGDGKADISVFRPSNGTWYRLNSANDSFTGIQFGANGDSPTAADYDGDGKADISVFRPSDGSWYRVNSTNSQFIAAQFGANGDKAVPSAHLQ